MAGSAAGSFRNILRTPDLATEISRLGEIRMSSHAVRTVAAVYDRRIYTFSDTAPLSRGTIKPAVIDRRYSADVAILNSFNSGVLKLEDHVAVVVPLSFAYQSTLIKLERGMLYVQTS